MAFNDGTNLNHISKYIVDATGATPYTTIQSAIDAANTAGVGGLVYIRQGTYVENLTLYDNVHLQGVVTDTTITGIHTPPASGIVTLDSLTLASATHILNSAAAGSTNLIIQNSLVNVTNGYWFNIPNWTGQLIVNNSGTIGTNDGGVNNVTGSSEIKFINTEMGAGGIIAFESGSGSLFRLDTMNMNCPMNIRGSGNVIIQNACKFASLVTISGSRSGLIVNSTFTTGANQALNTTSSGTISLSDITIETSNNPAIGGTGTIEFGSVTFLDNEVIAGTITQNLTTALKTGAARTTVIEAVGEGAGAQNVIDITPNTAIGGVAWRGIDIDGAALDPTAANSTVYGLSTDLSGVATTNNPDLRGVNLIMPATISEGCDAAATAQGYGILSTVVCSEREAGFFTDGTVEQEADITAFTAVDTGVAKPVTIDNTGSTGGDFHVLDVSVTGGGSASVVAVGTNPEVEVIHQHTGVFAATAQSWKFNGGFTDVTAAFDNPGVDVTIFDGDNDYIYIGANATFSQIRVILNTVSGRNIFPIFEYSTVGPVWVPFTPTDGTNGFLQNGIIEFDSSSLAGWAAVLVNGANHFYIRIQRTRNNIVTTPIEDTIRILEPVEYSWNEDGDIVAASVTANGLADTTGTQHEILTFGAGGILNGIGPLTDGQLVVGDTGGTAVAATLTAGTGIGIVNAAGSVTINSTTPFATGSWTPQLEFGGATTGITYTTQSGSYTRIGDLATLFCHILLSSKGTANGNATITGAPFSNASIDTASASPVGQIAFAGASGYAMAELSSTSNVIRMRHCRSGQAIVDLTDVRFVNTSEVIFSLTYKV